ncbi:RadC family protein [Rubrivivax sp. RP6-9]|uniref:RadC family protein n=1 Tax=Rubrivivax sp. RP6-9 TaxID=3415750 RepID=UPI003CC5D311
MPLKDLPADQRPREKLLTRGAAALSDGELLALLLRTGYRGHGVFDLAQTVLAGCGGFAGLLAATPATLKQVKGLGPAKRAELLAVAEIARRALAQQLQQAPVFDAPQTVKDYVALRLGGRGHETFSVLFLDGQHRLLVMEDLFHGTLTQTSVYPREIVKRALALNAGALVLAHNHPSGLAEPSRADTHLTQTLKAALQLVDVRVLDHLVVGQGQVVSLAERGLL